MKVCYCGSWIPNSIFGFCKGTFSAIKAIWISIKLLLLPPKPRPEIVIIDTSPVTLLLLGRFSSYPTLYVEHFPVLKDILYFTSCIKITPSLFSAWWLKYANEIIVQSECISRIFRRSYPNIQKEVRVLYPCVDIGVWRNDCIDINRIIPDLPDEYILFSVFGRYNKRSNFRLAFHAFEHLLTLLDDNLSSKIYLVFAGYTRTADEVIYYTDMITMVKNKTFANQITFLRQVPVIHKKTIISKSTAVLHTAKYEVFTGVILAAMHLGAPVIATNTGIALIIISHRITGILVEPQAHKFAAAMYKLILKPTLREFIKDMANDSFKTNYSFESFSRRLYQILVRHDRRELTAKQD